VVNNIVGLKIAEGREKLGMTQKQLAKLIFISPQAVSKWERGESLPNIFMLGRIGSIIGNTDINYFLGKLPCKCSPNGCNCEQRR